MAKVRKVDPEVEKQILEAKAIRELIGDRYAQFIGIDQKGNGGKWYKSNKTGSKYRIIEADGGFKIAETVLLKDGAQAAVVVPEAARTAEKGAKAAPKAKEAPKAAKKAQEGSRAALIQEAKARGIKYFRILNKKELGEVLTPHIGKERIVHIQMAAKARWQRGWKVNKKA